MLRLILLSLVACSGSSSSATCGEGTQLVGGVCISTTQVTCGAGTMLANGVCVADTGGCAANTVKNAAGECEPANTACAQGTTFDVMTHTCTPNIAGCGPSTRLENGACVGVGRVSFFWGIPLPGNVDMYAVSLDALLAAQSGVETAYEDAIPLASSIGTFQSTPLAELPLELGGVYVFLFTQAGDMPNIVNVEVLSTVLTPGLVAVLPPSAPTPQPFTYTPGDHLVFISSGVGIDVPFPTEAGQGAQANVNLTIFDISYNQLRVVLTTPGETHDAFSWEPVMSSLARTHDRQLTPGAQLLSVEVQADTYAAFETDGLQAGGRYVCIYFQGGRELLCHDGAAYPAAPSGVIEPTGYLMPTPVDLDGDRGAGRLYVNALTDRVVLRETGTDGRSLQWLELLADGALQTRLLAGVTYQLSMEVADEEVGTFTLAMPSPSARDSFFVIAHPASPTLVHVPEPTQAAGLTYSVLNTSDASVGIELPLGSTTSLAPAATVAIASEVACPGGGDELMEVHGECFTANPCGYGEHALVLVAPSGAPIVYETDGDKYTLVSTDCP